MVLKYMESENEQIKKKCCGTCKWHKFKNVHAEWICINGESDYVADWTDYNFYCEDYEEREE